MIHMKYQVLSSWHLLGKIKKNSTAVMTGSFYMFCHNSRQTDVNNRDKLYENLYNEAKASEITHLSISALSARLDIYI